MNTGATNEAAKVDIQKAHEITEIINSLPNDTKITLYGIIEGLRLAANMEKQPA